ncbi:integrin-linked protein kinase 1-like [Amaranthus tricolor]|uniref:integrin-linked protein kinase 1-like n=1 Tax=Amaranthus tricolor TaxID=29722 RepID=UPI00258A038D|nr:integrin-linked protein kinase 1-like [Amaranthus tricolor]
MDSPGAVRFPLGRQSSYAALDKLACAGDDDVNNHYTTSDADNHLIRPPPLIELTDGSSDGAAEPEENNDDLDEIEIPASVKLMFAAHEGDLEGIKELVEESNADVNFRDIDNRTPLHVASCQGYVEVVDLLIQMNADVDPKDRWGSTPLADAIFYKNHEVVKLLENHGAKPPMAPMHVKNAHDVPEYEIDPQEIDFSNSRNINKGTFLRASWRGIEVAVKKLGDEVFTNEDKLRAFRDELSLLQRIRHPNVVQFLGAVTQHTPMMIVTEFLPRGDFCEFLQNRGPLRPKTAVRYALDIARGMSYLHEIKPLPIIHCDLEPSNILCDDSGHLKVADFGVSKLLKVSKGVEEDRPVPDGETSCRYMAPELFRNENYDTKVDVFSFALILQEMIEGCPPFASMDEKDAQKAYCANERPPFRAAGKPYAHGLKELIEECWNEDPRKRPTFREIIPRLDHIFNHLGRRKRWIKVRPLKCFQRNESSLGSSSYAI